MISKYPSQKWSKVNTEQKSAMQELREYSLLDGTTKLQLYPLFEKIRLNFSDPSYFLKYLKGNIEMDKCKKKIIGNTPDIILDDILKAAEPFNRALQMFDFEDGEFVMAIDGKLKANYCRNHPLFEKYTELYGANIPLQFVINWTSLKQTKDGQSTDVYNINNFKDNGNVQLLGLLHPWHYKQLLIEFIFYNKIHNSDLPVNVKLVERNAYNDLMKARNAILSKNVFTGVMYENVSSFYPQFYIHSISWIATKSRNDAFLLRDEKCLWHNGMEYAFTKAQGNRTLGIPIAGTLVDSLMQVYMEYIMLDIHSDITKYFSNLGKETSNLFYILCRSDNLEIYLNVNELLPGTLSNVRHHLRMILIKRFGLYGLFLNYSKSMYTPNPGLSGISALKGCRNQWISANSLSGISPVMDLAKSTRHPDVDIMMEYVIESLTKIELLIVLKSILESLYPEAHYCAFKRLILTNFDEKDQNAIKNCLELWLENPEMYPFRAQPCIQLYWALACCKRFKVDVSKIKLDFEIDDAILYLLLKDLGIEIENKQEMIKTPQWSSLFFKSVIIKKNNK